MSKKIPKDKSDKDMLAGYVEEQTVEDQMLAQAKLEAQRRREIEKDEPPANLSRAGFTRQLTDELGRELLQLKFDLAKKGVEFYNFKIRRDGENIVLIPTYKI
ncbi:MAG: hypothetical protein IJ575_06740 [Selenomonadaceae bacterium]|nr:hypothetical protein [Selenomonadaceae bacterium]